MRCCSAVPASAAKHKQQERNAERGQHPHRQHPARASRSAGPSVGNLIGIGDEAAQRRLQAPQHRRREHHQRHRAAGDHEPGADFGALDDVAATMASSSRRGVGSCVRSVSSASSAIATMLRRGARARGARRRHNRETAHHRARAPAPGRTAEQDRQRQRDEEDLHLRHQPRQHAEPEIEQQPEHQKRRRQLDADAEGAGNDLGDQRRDSPVAGTSPGSNSV